MNPSANGWIKKLFKLKKNDDNLAFSSSADFYLALRQSGFIYGSNVFICEQQISKQLAAKKNLTEDEIAKVNLLLALHYIHVSNKVSIDFFDTVVTFYKSINHKTSFFEEFINKHNSKTVLEKIIHKRIQLDDNFITKNFNYFVINALLFIDVLAYDQYLKNQQTPINYLKQFEANILNITAKTFYVKTQQTAYDKSFIKLIEASLRYIDTSKIKPDSLINFTENFAENTLESMYLLDVACMAAWSDAQIDKQERLFLETLAEDLKLQKTDVAETINAISFFYTNYKSEIPLFSAKNAVQSFYDNATKLVKKLISRNRKRLQLELQESKELVVLLTQSTIRELTADEQKKVQNQLIDVFKTIPSLAIFMLPGGAILLPLVIKIIPNLLPSSFDENRIEEE